ncbi:MAG: hypothetical protein IKL68_02025 [Clostridia bacterium]|nr:hypothetical protein [Clostridia bacterium]
MSSNKGAKNKLIEIYGKHCMFERAKVAERIERMGGIRTYKSYLVDKKFKGKRIVKQLTYHHLVHKADGGRATVENGVVVDSTAHAYMHSLPRHQEEIINNMLRAYKINALELRDGQVIRADSVQVEDDIEFISIPIETDEAEIRRARAIYEKKKQEQFSRAKVKEDTRRKIEEYWEKQYETDR